MRALAYLLYHIGICTVEITFLHQFGKMIKNQILFWAVMYMAMSVDSRYHNCLHASFLQIIIVIIAQMSFFVNYLRYYRIIHIFTSKCEIKCVQRLNLGKSKM